MKRLALGMAVIFMLTGCQKPPQPQATQEQQTAAVQSEQSKKSAEYIAKAITYLQEAKPAEAVQNLVLAIQNNPQDLQPYLILGQTYMHLNDFDNAAQTYSAALRANPDQGEVYYLLAVANGLQGDKKQAIANAEKSLLIFQKERNEDNFRRALVLLQGLAQEQTAPLEGLPQEQTVPLEGLAQEQTVPLQGLPKEQTVP